MRRRHISARLPRYPPVYALSRGFSVLDCVAHISDFSEQMSQVASTGLFGATTSGSHASQVSLHLDYEVSFNYTSCEGEACDKRWGTKDIRNKTCPMMAQSRSIKM